MNNEKNIEKLAWEWTETKLNEVDIASDYYCQTRDIFQAKLDKMLRGFLQIKGLNEGNSYILSAIAGEIGNNSFDHNLGNWRDVPGIFFAYEISENEIRIILADRGQGVLKTLKKAKPELKSDAEALKTAFMERISGRTPENRGNGLKFVRENVEAREMHLDFYSGSAKIELNKNIKINEAAKETRGCLAILILKL